MKPKSLFFDMDGTLIDSEPIHFMAYKAMLLGYGKKIDEKMFSSFVGNTTEKNIIWLKKEFNLCDSVETLLNKKLSLFITFLPKLRLFPNVPQLLKSASKKYTLALVTSTTSPTTKVVLHHTGLFKFFTHIITGDLGIPKPDPTLYRIALDKMQVLPNQVIAFEDSRAGYDAANSAGIECIAIPNKYTHEQFSENCIIAQSLKAAVGRYL